MPRKTGAFIITSAAGERVKAFVPHPLPPAPPIERTPLLDKLRAEANQAIGRLDTMSTFLPQTSLFIYLYVRKEALLSSQLEGTQSSLSELLIFEHDGAPGAPLDDVVEVSNYVAAIEYGLKRLRGGFPLSLRLIKEIHGVLLSKGRGSSMTPGEFRRTQNWIGGARPGTATFVPPPPHEVVSCMGSLELFLHDHSTPTLMKAALAHVQFETIHPFLDGNGRLGRLMITLLLCAERALSEPLLYLSLYFKTHRSTYFELLQAVRTKGEWEQWITFFLEGVVETSHNAVEAAQKALRLFERSRTIIDKMGRPGGSASRVHQLMQRNPIVPINKVSELLSMSKPTVAAALGRLEAAGVVREITGKKRGKLYLYSEYIDILSEGTEPL